MGQKPERVVRRAPCNQHGTRYLRCSCPIESVAGSFHGIFGLQKQTAWLERHEQRAASLEVHQRDGFASTVSAFTQTDRLEPAMCFGGRPRFGLKTGITIGAGD
ncbi:hypothetical protein KM043_016861 [Ampulex compressa]|nr:hypothetical protein KM043_016861 [Ampulex compressa]